MAVSERRAWQLEGDLRQALENFCGGPVSGPWDDIIEAWAQSVQTGRLDLGQAARLDLALNRTQGALSPDTCETCKCPCPGMTHR